jgi:hypothetical protein
MFLIYGVALLFGLPILILFAMKIYQFLIIFCLLALAVKASAQNARIRFYDSCKYQIDKCIDKKNYGAAVFIYETLYQNQGLLATDIGIFWGLSLLAEDSAGFYQASQLLILKSALPIENITDKFGRLSTRSYEINYTSEKVAQNKIFSGTYERLQLEGYPLVSTANNALDWKWIMFLEGIFVSNTDYRYLPDPVFAGSNGKHNGIIFTDSTHFMRISEFIKSNGFPTMSRLGMNAGELQPLLKHFIALVEFSEEQRSDYFLGVWKSLFPQMYKATSDGEMEPDFYRYLYRSLERSLAKIGHSEKMEFFKQYELCKTIMQ